MCMAKHCVKWHVVGTSSCSTIVYVFSKSPGLSRFPTWVFPPKPGCHRLVYPNFGSRSFQFSFVNPVANQMLKPYPKSGSK